MPTTVVGLEKWLQERWADKEKALEAFYTEGHSLSASSSLPQDVRPVLPLQYFSLAAWTAFLWHSSCTLFLSLSGWIWMICIGGLMAFVSSKTAGWQEIEITLEKNGGLIKALMAKMRGEKSD